MIQLPSGSMPTISEWACCDIIRTSWWRYCSGIQSLGSIVSPASMRASNAAAGGGVVRGRAAGQVGTLACLLELGVAARSLERLRATRYLLASCIVSDLLGEGKP